MQHVEKASLASRALQLTLEQVRAFDEADSHLCGSNHVAGGRSSRGKVYVEAVMDVTGEHLCMNWIPPEKVRKMYRTLAACDPEKVPEDSNVWDVTPNEIIGLRRFLEVCAEHELGLIDWW